MSLAGIYRRILKLEKRTRQPQYSIFDFLCLLHDGSSQEELEEMFQSLPEEQQELMESLIRELPDGEEPDAHEERIHSLGENREMDNPGKIRLFLEGSQDRRSDNGNEEDTELDENEYQ